MKAAPEDTTPRTRRCSQSLLGKVAIANAKLTYQRYKEIFSGPRWEALARKARRRSACCGPAPAPRTPSYRDVMYVEELIGPDTVNTIPPADLRCLPRSRQAARQPRRRTSTPRRTPWKRSRKVGISMKEVTDDLLDDRP